jgi:hypothetical protein
MAAVCATTVAIKTSLLTTSWVRAHNRFIGVRGITVRSTAFAGYDTDTIPAQVDFYGWLKIYDGRTASPLEEVSSNLTDSNNATAFPLYFLYESLPRSSNIFTTESITSMAAFERSLLEETGWTMHCKKAVNRLYPDEDGANCSSPVTILRFLYVNDALHEQQCRQGYCDLFEFQYRQAVANGESFVPNIAYCHGGSGTWGVWPCTSTIYDWRDGVLGSQATWAAEVVRRLCTVGSLRDQLQPFLLEMHAACQPTGLTYSLDASYVRSNYPLASTQTDDGEVFAEANDVFIQEMMATLDASQTDLSATAPGSGEVSDSGKPVNIWWMCGPHPALGWCDWDGSRMQKNFLLPDMSMALFSMVFIMLLIFANTGSALLTLAGIFEILISLPVAMFAWVIFGQTHVNALMLLGLFVVLCIGADDIFVFMETWRESAVMPPHIAGSMLTRFTWTWNRAANAMAATTTTTFFCMMLNALSRFGNIRVFGIFNAFVILSDYILVISWFAAGAIGLEYISQRSCPPGQNFEMSCCFKGNAEQEKRPWTAFFKDTLAPLIYKLRYGLLLLSLIILIVGVVLVAATFDEGETTWFRRKHPVEKGRELFTDQFEAPGGFRHANIVYYGMKDTAVSYPSYWNQFARLSEVEPKGKGYLESFTPHWRTGFVFGPTEQLKIVDDCIALRANTQNVVEGEAYCILNELQAWSGAAFPYPDEVSLLAALNTFYVSSHYEELLANHTDYGTFTGFVADPAGDILAMYNAFNTTIPYGITRAPKAIQVFYDPWQAAVDAQCTSEVPCAFTNYGPPSGSSTQSLFYFMATIRELVREAVLNIVIALVVSYVVLVVATRNVSRIATSWPGTASLMRVLLLGFCDACVRSCACLPQRR